MLVANAFHTKGNVKDCSKVLASSKSYREAQDSITEFLNSRICKSTHGCISKTLLTEQFREWFACNQGGKAPTMKEVCIQAEKTLGASRNGIWEGYHFKPILSSNIDRVNIVENDEIDEKEKKII